jgi:hypothetical protein
VQYCGVHSGAAVYDNQMQCVAAVVGGQMAPPGCVNVMTMQVNLASGVANRTSCEVENGGVSLYCLAAKVLAKGK